MVLTAGFLIVIMGATSKQAAAQMGGLGIGALALALIHFISIPVTNTSVNPARSTSQAVIANFFGEGVTLPMQQLWLFWAAPIVGAVIGAVVYRALIDSNIDVQEADPDVTRTDASTAASRAAQADMDRTRSERAVRQAERDGEIETRG